jgi:hypothetical protein
MPTTGITPRSQVVYETSILVSPDEAGTYYFSQISVSSNTTALVVGSVTNDAPDVGEDILQAPIRGVGHKRRYGIQSRHVTITRITGASPNQGRIYRVIPILSNDNFAGIIAQIYSAPEVSYEAQTDWTIAGVSAESYGIS